MNIKPWTIYLWRNGDKMEGASPVVTRDGIKQIYCHGWEIEVDHLVKRNEDKHQEWRAKVKVKNLLNNTLNVLNWYGKKVLDNEGNIDAEKLRLIEIKNGIQAFKESERTKKNIDLSDIYPIKKFPTKDITVKQAYDWGFIGDLIQNKFVNKHN